MKKMLLSAAALVFLAACGGTSIGNACTTDADCDNTQTCDTSLPGGYCTKGCLQEGNDKECPGGSLCIANGGRFQCSDSCSVANDCRDGYECSATSDSTGKACRLPTP